MKLHPFPSVFLLIFIFLRLHWMRDRMEAERVAFTLAEKMSIAIMWRFGVYLHTNSIYLRAARKITHYYCKTCYFPALVGIHSLPFVLAVLLAACQPPDAAPRRTTMVRIAGSTAMQPVLYDLTTAFTDQQPTVFFALTGGDSTTGEEQVMAGQVDLAASTLISSTVTDTAGQHVRQTTAIRIPIGLDGLAVIVHPDNAVAKLTLTQLQALYNGRILTWEEVGGPALEVLLISREEGSGNRQLFDERVMGEERVSLTAVVMPTSRDVVDYVAARPNAIGYVSRAYVINAIEQAGQPGAGATQEQPTTAPTVKVVMLEEQLPTQQTIQSQSYPLIQPLFLVSRTRPTGVLQQFIDFALSPAGQAIIARYHGRVR